MLARHLSISRTIVHRVWLRHDLQPHRVERFKLSNDPHFEQKVRDVVGLYLDPPDRALVLCVDEKSQIQALDRPGPILEKELPADQEVHLIMDNYCTHKSAEVQRWLKPKKRKRFHFHFTPTSSSWLNEVERFFALITGRMIRRGTFQSAEELEKAIYRCLASWNGDPTPFVWKASADVILDKVRRCKELSNTGD